MKRWEYETFDFAEEVIEFLNEKNLNPRDCKIIRKENEEYEIFYKIPDFCYYGVETIEEEEEDE